MPLTNAEKQRRYKEKLKGCGKYDHFRERHRNEVQKSRTKQKHLESTLPSPMKKIQQDARRVATRRRVASYREKRKTKEAMKKLPFSSARAYAKATARVRDRLPETPHRRKAVCRNLCWSELGNDIHPLTTITAATPPTTNPRGLSDETVEVIQQFYQRDDISRQAPGRKDVVNIWPKEGGKIKKQMRHLTSSIMETFALFWEDYPNIKVGKSKFAELRPKHVLLSNKLPHNVCMCRYHENFMYAVNSLHDASPEFPAYSHDLPAKLLCQNPTREWWFNECDHCKNGAGFMKNFDIDQGAATWYVWKSGEDNRLIKFVEEGTTVELAEYICSLIPQFVQHCFIKRHQAASYNLERERAGSNSFNPTEALIQIDFSENYTCVSQDEIQGAHWNQRQVSLFTVALWHSGSLHSSVVASDSLVHSKDTVVAYVDKVLDGLPQALKSASVWSDGPASQFKNRFIAAAIIRLQEKHNLKIRWNFFSTSHGKGPVDGIVGAVKRHVWSQVKSRKAIITNAESFVAAATGMPKVETLLMQQAEIEARNSDLGLKSVFENAKQIVGMASKHHLQVQNKDVISFTITDDGNSSAERNTPHGDRKATENATCSGSGNDGVELGDWYAVEYEGVLYPGVIEAKGDQNDVQVSVMQPAGPNWKWPNPRDKIFYLREKLITKLDAPTLANNRGHFKFSVTF